MSAIVVREKAKAACITLVDNGEDLINEVDADKGGSLVLWNEILDLLIIVIYIDSYQLVLGCI